MPASWICLGALLMGELMIQGPRTRAAPTSRRVTHQQRASMRPKPSSSTASASTRSCSTASSSALALSACMQIGSNCGRLLRYTASTCGGGGAGDSKDCDDGQKVVCWGADFAGQSSVPPAINRLIASVSLGTIHTSNHIMVSMASIWLKQLAQADAWYLHSTHTRCVVYRYAVGCMAM